jgi:hypothetical protein
LTCLLEADRTPVDTCVGAGTDQDVDLACCRRPEAIADALFGFLGAHKSGRFETVHEVFVGDEAYDEWKWVGATNEGESAESHGCDYYLVRDGKVAVKNTFRKV